MGNPSDYRKPRAIREAPDQRHPGDRIPPSAYDDELKNVVRALKELSEALSAAERKLQQQQRELQDLRVYIKEIKIRRTNNRDQTIQTPERMCQTCPMTENCTFRADFTTITGQTQARYHFLGLRPPPPQNTTLPGTPSRRGARR